jgi:hypothetical protein
VIVEVVGMPLLHRGARVSPGTRVEVPEHTAHALIGLHRARRVEVAPAQASKPTTAPTPTHQKRR